uniref:Uncharacterized protein n=1 Tax=Pararge aegeria TaxID=116150 RepID=S4PR25_9NEOP
MTVLKRCVIFDVAMWLRRHRESGPRALILMSYKIVSGQSCTQFGFLPIAMVFNAMSSCFTPFNVYTMVH